MGVSAEGYTESAMNIPLYIIAIVLFIGIVMIFEIALLRFRIRRLKHLVNQLEGIDDTRTGHKVSDG